jgi:hypothetical protein
MTSRIGAAAGGGDLGERFVEGAGCFLRGESAGATTT